MNEPVPNKRHLWLWIGVPVLLLLLGGGYFLVSKAWPIYQQMRDTIEKASAAPGTDALRDLGCKQAMVLPAGAFSDLFPDAAKKSEVGAGPDYVACIAPGGEEPLTCEEVSERYFESAGPFERDVLVAILDGETREPTCMVGRDGEGNPKPSVVPRDEG